MPCELVKYGDPVLKVKSSVVAEFDADLADLARNLKETLVEKNGLGLAAPQIGVLKRVFVADMRLRYNTDTPCNFTIDGKSLPLDIAMPLVAVNPEVFAEGDCVVSADEGCLSFPGIFAEVERSSRVSMKYFDTDGNPHDLFCDGIFARCVQHENDHLNGVCFIDRLKQKDLLKIGAKLRKLKKQTRKFLKDRSGK